MISTDQSRYHLSKVGDTPSQGVYSENIEKLLDQVLSEKKKYIITNLDRTIFDSDILSSPSVFNAISLARKYHYGQKRKGDGYPYIEHPLEVGYTLWKNKFSDDIIAAGFCHDLLEDTACPQDEISTNCTAEVLRIVKAVSNDESLSDPKDWEKKKEKYIKTVESGGESAIAVCIADKICNLKSFFWQYQKIGPELWKKFNRGREKKIWFEKAVHLMSAKHWVHPLLDQHKTLIKQLEENTK